MVRRDGYMSSLWQSTAEPFHTDPGTPGKKSYDVIIVGGGITGLSTAVLLQEKGKRCLLLEAKNLGFGTTGGTTAHLNTMMDTPYTTITKKFSADVSRQVASAAASAIDLIRSNIQRFNISCEFSERDAFLFAQDDKQVEELEKIQEANLEAGLDSEFAGDIPVPIPMRKAIRVRGQAQFHPLKYLYAMAYAFIDAGGTLLEQCRVTDVRSAEPLEVLTSRGEFLCTDIIYATHIPPGVNLLHMRCSPWRSYAMAVTLRDNQYPEALAYDMADPYHYYRTQEIDNTRFLIAGGKDHKTGDETDTQGQFELLEETIRKYFNVKEIGYAWSSQYFEPADGLPYIGHLPGNPEHIFAATGFGGNGMIYSSISALIFRGILLNEFKPAIDTDLFNPNRLKPIAGFTQFVTHNADTVKNLISRIFPGDHSKLLSELKAGEGKIISHDKEKIAVYKSETGKIHAVDPVCTHLKCEIRWNAAERSWDCPCHGSRFDINGQVITGPADIALEKITIPAKVEKK